MMVINKIDIDILYKMIISASNNLENHREEIDALNVFPIPDGDTGTNMSMTLKAAAAELRSNSYLRVDKAMQAVSSATLRGARGNSGVILSQIFRGFAQAVKSREFITPKEVLIALKCGADTAFKAVMKPTEGTILTVIKACSAAAFEAIVACTDYVEAFEYVIEKGNQALAKTRYMLPALKQAGVVDAGGKGLICIFEGMFYAMRNNSILPLETRKSKSPAGVGTSFVETDFTYTYCTEFLVSKASTEASAEVLKRSVMHLGDSLVCVDDSDMIKLHIHTNNPGRIIELGTQMGELLSIKIDNMHHQHRQLIEQGEPMECGIISVCSGTGVAHLFEELGSNVIINGGQTQNPSAEEILMAINALRAAHILIFPNNKNVTLTARQAADISGKRVSVMPSYDIPSGLTGIIEYDPNKSAEDNEEAIRQAIENVQTALVTKAVRDTVVGEMDIKTGNILGICNRNIEICSDDINRVALDCVRYLCNDDTQLITVIYGEEADEYEQLEQQLEDMFPDADVSFYEGKQPLYPYMIAVV